MPTAEPGRGSIVAMVSDIVISPARCLPWLTGIGRVLASSASFLVLAADHKPKFGFPILRTHDVVVLQRPARGQRVERFVLAAFGVGFGVPCRVEPVVSTALGSVGLVPQIDIVGSVGRPVV